MTIEEARRLVERGRAHDSKGLDNAELRTAITMLRDRASSLYDETQRESARWLAATGERRCRSLLELSLPLLLSQTENLTHFMGVNPAQARDTSSLIRIANLLLQWVDAMYDGLMHDLARWDSAPADVRQRRIEGHRLVRQVENGQTSYLLGGKLLSAGVTLWLLTSAGWIPGIFQTYQGDPTFEFSPTGRR